MRRATILISIVITVCCAYVFWSDAAVLDAMSADSAFAEAQALSDGDAAAMWGVALYGPVLLVDRETREAFGNARDDAGVLRPQGSVYFGVMPDSVGLANTAVSWGGKDWTMLLWPLPDEDFARRALIAHELWHRVQDEIGLPSRDPGSAHLAEYDGRLWLQLEWRALAAALRSGGEARDQAVRDALAFRAYRRAAFVNSREAERQLELHEGLAEYTGVVLSGRGVSENAETVAKKLEKAESNATFVRSFAYASGPAYGLLLNDYGPGWRTQLTLDDDLGDLLAVFVGGLKERSLVQNTDTAVRKYDGDALIMSERKVADDRRARIASFKKRYVEGPILRLGFIKMNVTFDPGKVDAMEGLGNIYTSMKITDKWGVLNVTDGGLITADWSAAVVPAPGSVGGNAITGDGYTLQLAPGWELVPNESGFHVKELAH